MAEIAAAPFVVRTLLALENNVGVWKEGEEKKVLEILEGGELERVWKWFEFLSGRESVKNTWDPVRGHSNHSQSPLLTDFCVVAFATPPLGRNSFLRARLSVSPTSGLPR